MDAIQKHIIKSLIIESKVCFGMDISPLISDGLINIKHARKWLIMREFDKRLKCKERNITGIKQDLSVEYDVSESLIDKLVYNGK